MTATRPFGIDAAFPNASDFRRAFAGVVQREGIFPDADSVANGVAYAGTGWNVSCRASRIAFRRGTVGYGTGIAMLEFSSAQWTITPAPVSGTRTDRLWVLFTDPTEGDSMSGAPTDGPGGAARAVPSFGVATGSGGGVTAIPAGAMEIARVAVPAGASSIAGATIANTHPYAQVAGGLLFARTTAELAALSGGAGDEAYCVANSSYYAHNGTGWIRSRRTDHAGRTGSGNSGIDIPSGAVAMPAGAIMKTGHLTAATSVSFGNEYFPVVTFPEAFPNQLLSLSILPVYQSPATGPAASIGIDNANATQFRAVIPGSPNPWIRSFLWTAIGF